VGPGFGGGGKYRVGGRGGALEEREGPQQRWEVSKKKCKGLLHGHSKQRTAQSEKVALPNAREGGGGRQVIRKKDKRNRDLVKNGPMP